MTATKTGDDTRHFRSLQVFAAPLNGKCLYVHGDPTDPEPLKVRDGYDRPEREATAEERRAIQIEEAALRIIDRDVLCCDTSLVGSLISADAAGEITGDMAGEFDMSEVSNLRPDPSAWDLEQCKEWLEDEGHDLPDPNPWGMDRDELAELLCVELTDEDGNDFAAMTAESLLEKAITEINDEITDGLDDWREAVRDNSNDAEVYQWFRITPYLLKRLDQIGEPVLNNNYGEWWGRTCCGQSIIMDGTFQKIAAMIVDAK